jgi:allantoin racemase
MKIIYVVPGPMDLSETARRGELLKKWASPGTQVDITRVEEGPASIESAYEEYLSIPATAKLIFQLEKQGYHAAILGCAGDPGLEAMREITLQMAVVGPGETSMLIAAMLGYRFSLLTVMDSMIASGYELAHRAGVAAKLASVKAINVAVLDLAKDKAATLDKIVRVGRQAIQEDGAHSLVLGCMSMGFLNVAEEVQEILEVPVINPSKVVLKTAEALVGSGLSHSKKAYPLPPKLAEGKVKSLDELHVSG